MLCYQESSENFYIFDKAEKYLDIYDKSFKFIKGIKVVFDLF